MTEETRTARVTLVPSAAGVVRAEAGGGGSMSDLRTFFKSGMGPTSIQATFLRQRLAEGSARDRVKVLPSRSWLVNKGGGEAQTRSLTDQLTGPDNR